MNEALRLAKGLGSTDIYARIRNDTDQFWDFNSSAWVSTETAYCRAFLAEFGEMSTTKSWYCATFSVPGGGPYPVEIIQLSTGQLMGNDVSWNDSSPPTPPTPPTPGMGLAGTLNMAARQIQDVANVTWPLEVLLVYMNYACQEIVNIKPEAGSVIALLPLVAGTRQAIPDAWNLLIHAKRNMGTGTTPGRMITSLPKIDQVLPDWQTWPPTLEVRYIITDDRDPRSFDVFPPQPADTTQQIEAIGSMYPARVFDISVSTLPLDAQYEVAIIDYIIYRALAEDNEASNIQTAQVFYNKFLKELGAQAMADLKTRQGAVPSAN